MEFIFCEAQLYVLYYCEMYFILVVILSAITGVLEKLLKLHGDK
jgi:hypothetical protein